MNWLKLLKRKAQIIFSLSEYERSLLFQALCLLPAVAILVNFKGLRFSQKMLLRLPTSSSSVDDTVAEIDRVWMTERMVRVAVRYNHLWTNCLKQSLVLWILLRSQGIISELRIGVQRESDKFSAHAWVEYQGVVLNDTEDVRQRFQAFDRSFEQPVGEKL
ncbi:lasso peptide biosynthesis B2 protein [Chamaesiphon sp. VAR_48_metabat_135_sub]|uniref:lasso peptide biosynthesis B2 protein n=1 Tax=Chamaesiphon sp. VAR_48_metabat_135_sub TaxID=2964699 RepID=UPI00286CED7E|nr:lasso peptide biosynthesis B2 protein [Chamaesiphon sp. VAR_48_metabat_135_sub]